MWNIYLFEYNTIELDYILIYVLNFKEILLAEWYISYGS